MSRAALSRIALCLLLGASPMAMAAHEVSMHGPNGDGGSCPDATAASATATPVAKSVAPTASHIKPKPAIGLRGGGSDDGVGASHAPRWHSFLPGMFR